MDREHKLKFEHRLTETADRAKSNSRRLDKMEKRQENLEELVSSVKVLATRQEAVESDVKEIKKVVKEIDRKPGKRWDAIVEKVILTVVSAITLFMLAKLGF